MEIIVSILFMLLIMWLAIGFLIFNLSIKSRKKKSIIKRDGEEKRPAEVGCLKYYKQDYISGSDGVSLNGYYAFSTQTSPWAICIHGYGGRAIDMVEYAEMFKNLGMNVLMVDLRGHGDSQGNYHTLGVRESDDIILWTNWLKKTFKADKIILLGISMGGATSLMAAAKKSELYSSVISDSAPSDFSRIIMPTNGAVFFDGSGSFSDIRAQIKHGMPEDVRRKKIAAALGYTEEHISRVFNRYIGSSISAYLNRVRIEYIERLRRDGDKRPTIELIYESGFKSQQTYYRVKQKEKEKK